MSNNAESSKNNKYLDSGKALPFRYHVDIVEFERTKYKNRKLQQCNYRYGDVIIE
jgi:hypothetical protein